MTNTEMMTTWPREREGVPFNTATWNRLMNFLNGEQYGRVIFSANTAAVYPLTVNNPAGPIAIFGGGVFVIQQTFVWANVDLAMRGGHALVFWNAANTNSANLYHSGTNDILTTDDALWVAGAISSGITPGATPAGYLLLSANPRWLSGGSFYVELDHAATANRVVTVQDLAGTVALLGAANAGGNLIFVDATYDIGASGATRPRDLFLSRDATVGRNLVVTGTVSLSGATGIATDVAHGSATAPTWGPITATDLGVNVPTLLKIAETTLAAAAATIDFTNIPQTYRSLYLEVSSRNDTGTTTVLARLSTDGTTFDAGANYDYQYHYGNAAVTAATEGLAQTSLIVGVHSTTANIMSGATVHFPDYANTAYHKELLSQANLKTGTASASLTVYNIAGFWRNTSAVKGIRLLAGANNFGIGTRATLWGLPL